MGFQEIHPNYLVYNKEYKIGHHFRGIYKGKRWTEYAYPRHGWGCHFEFENVRHLDNTLFAPIMIFSNVSFSEFFSEKEAIQICMEHRAVNLILRKVIGDDTFSWAEPTVPHLPCRGTPLRPHNINPTITGL